MRVRLSPGALRARSGAHDPLAQPGRAPGLHPARWRFKSSGDHAVRYQKRWRRRTVIMQGLTGQSGVPAALSVRRSRVRVPLGPLAGQVRALHAGRNGRRPVRRRGVPVRSLGPHVPRGRQCFVRAGSQSPSFCRPILAFEESETDSIIFLRCFRPLPLFLDPNVSVIA